MKTTKVTEKLSVSPQPKLADFQELKRLGFSTVINNRPDGEDPTQPGSAAEAEAARAAGLAYVHIPVTTSGMSAEDARHMREAIEGAPGPVLAHCRSGARSFYLSVLSGALDSYSDTDLLGIAANLGVDPAAAANFLAAYRKGVGK